MPQMGESIAEGTLSRWLKKAGDEIKRDEPLFEISTDKVDAEIPAPAAGVLAEILVLEGQTVPVQTVVARLETEKGAAVASPAGGDGAGAAKADSDVAKAAVGPGAGSPVAKSQVAGASAAGGPPPTKESMPPRSSGPQRSSASPTIPSPGHGGSSLEERLRTRSSPLVRKIAAEHGIEIAAMPGSGIAGRVTKKDILSFIESGGAALVTGDSSASSVHATAPSTHGPLPKPWPGDSVEPMSKMRALISEHMVGSRRTSAHVTSFMEIDFTRVSRIRAKNRAAFEAASGQKLTYMPFIIKSVVDGLKQFPVMNASVAGTNVIYRKQFNIGVAVALDWGLIVPVIRGADDLSLSGITRALNDLADRARVKKLDPREVQDGTFTITNPGVFGSLMGTPIINQPQVAILGVGAIEKRPKVISGADGEDTIAIRTCAYFSISFDHRIIDGAIADQFLAFVKKTIETFPDAGI
ncbi:MAG: 2-oxo acid dehydrogenase subunit E2 [Anaerolineae bacterium]|nr:2-oxo acid dehydrogenase subunit E2 [Gemmatimonadaceae bacterium]